MNTWSVAACSVWQSKHDSRGFAGAEPTKPLHQSIHGGGEIGSPPPGGVGKLAKLLAQRQIQVTHARESLVEAFAAGIGRHSRAPQSEWWRGHMTAAG